MEISLQDLGKEKVFMFVDNEMFAYDYKDDIINRVVALLKMKNDGTVRIELKGGNGKW